MKKQIELIIYALREAFISLIPYLIVSSTATLAVQFLSFWSSGNTLNSLQTGCALLQDALPILILVSFSHEFAKLKNVDSTTSTLLALTLLVTLYPINSDTLWELQQPNHFRLMALLIPIASTLVLAKLLKSRWLVSPNQTPLTGSVRMIYRHTPAFLLSYIFVLIGLQIIYRLPSVLPVWHWAILDTLYNHAEWMIAIRTLCSHLLTFIGVHGTNIFDLLVNQDFLKVYLAPNLTTKNLLDIFVIYGGVGASLSLAIAIILIAKDRHAIKISKIAMPFLVFNISEILLYGLPVIFNRKLLIPFLLVPCVNLALSLMVVSTDLFTFNANLLPWTTPIFISGYLATDGNWLAVLFQALILTLDVAIYMFFVRSYTITQSTSEHLHLLKEKLQVSESIQIKQGIKFQEAQAYLVNSHLDIQKIIELIIDNQLVMFYQPIIDTKNQVCHSFEALLRLKMQDGKIIGPYFLPTIERAGLSTVLDLWVCQQVRLDLLAWRSENYHPIVTVNIHPDTLLDDESFAKVLELLSEFHVQFEVIERAFLNTKQTAAKMQMLNAAQCKLAIDDYGTGYSTLEHLHTSSADTIKFDKLLIDSSNTKKGYIIYYHTSQMCLDLGLRIVAEGIETEDQMNIVRKVGITFVQGWYFSKALPFSEVKPFSDDFHLKIENLAH